MSESLHTLPTPLGPMLLRTSVAGLSGAWFVGQRHYPMHLPTPVVSPRVPDHDLLAEACAQIQAYFGGQLRRFQLPLDLSAGTPFQQSVWQQLSRIDWGCTTSYGALAHALERPQAARAIGMAVGRNPLSIIVPCHRVLGSNGSLTGYAGGLDRKQDLLAREGVL